MPCAPLGSWELGASGNAVSVRIASERELSRIPSPERRRPIAIDLDAEVALRIHATFSADWTNFDAAGRGAVAVDKPKNLLECGGEGIGPCR